MYYSYEENKGELYHLMEDPDEINNLFYSNTYKDVKNHLQLELLKCIMQSNYKTAGYKNTNMKTPFLWPQENSYLHPLVSLNPEGWDCKDRTMEQ